MTNTLIENTHEKAADYQRLFRCDPVGIQTQDLQNRNLTLYSAKLRDLAVCGCKGTTIN